jgi:hypothetical protein
MKNIGYMCQVDFDHELGMSAHGNVICPTEESLRLARKCVRYCGIVEVKIKLLPKGEEGEDERVVYVERKDLESGEPYTAFPSPESKYHETLKNPVALLVLFSKVTQSAVEEPRK